MPNLLRTVTRLARSPQGRQALAKAKSAAADPRNKEKASELLDKAKGAVASRRSSSESPTTTPDEPPATPRAQP